MDDFTYSVLSEKREEVGNLALKNKKRYGKVLALGVFGIFTSYGALVASLPAILVFGTLTMASATILGTVTFVRDVKYVKKINEINLKINDCLTDIDKSFDNSFQNDEVLSNSNDLILSNSKCKVKKIGARR